MASGFYFGPGPSSANVVATHNLWNTMDSGCPDSILSGEAHAVCADPLLLSESSIEAINPELKGSSPAIGAGIMIGGVTRDYAGAVRSNPPSIGAFE